LSNKCAGDFHKLNHNIADHGISASNIQADIPRMQQRKEAIEYSVNLYGKQRTARAYDRIVMSKSLYFSFHLHSIGFSLNRFLGQVETKI
jgi:hypothetical protein